MLGRKGQSFDAFKLLISAVVAGAILVILLSMLGGFTTPSGQPPTVMAQTVQQLRGEPGSGVTSGQIVTFKKGYLISAKSVWTKAGVNPGTVGFCGGSCKGSPACGSSGGYVFKSPFFTATPGKVGDPNNPDTISATQNVKGYIWVYNTGGSDNQPIYCIGFVPVQS